MGTSAASVDPDIFTDPATGSSYLLWKSDGNHVGETTARSWSAPFSRNPETSTALSRLANPLLSAEEAGKAGIVEGPEMYDDQSGTAPTPANNYVLC